MEQCKQVDSPITNALYQKRSNLAEQAGVNRLEGFKYLDMIDRFSQKFNQHPDSVFKNTTFDTVTAFLIKWNEEAQYADRYSEIEKMMNQLNTPPQ